MSASGENLVYSSLEGLINQQRYARLLNAPMRRRKAARQQGIHQVRYLGRGMEFSESRPYYPGDDIRNMDWKVTARTGEPHSKVFEEERERPVMLWCDLRPNMFFATRGQFKSVVMCEMAALLAWRSWLAGDRVGGVVLSNGECFEQRPARNKSSVLTFMKQLADESARPIGVTAPAHSLRRSWERLHRVLTPGSEVFMLSDFRGVSPGAEQQLQRIARQTTLRMIQITDPFEHTLPDDTRLRLSDGERFAWLDTRSKRTSNTYQQRDASRQHALERLAAGAHVGLLSVDTDTPVHQRLAKLRGGML